MLAPPTRTRAIALLLFLAGVAVFVTVYLRLASFLTDDVFISVRYAQNLVRGAGLVYNAGERVEGYTNFLWTLLLAPPIAAGWPVIGWIKVMNALWAVAAGLLTVRLASIVARDGGEEASRVWTVLPGAVCLATVPFVLSAAEGLETMMFTALLLLTVSATWEARDDERVPRAALALVALGLTRPDGWAYLPGLVLAAFLRRRSPAWILRAVLVAVAGLAAHEIFRLAYYGDLVPNTLRAKSAGTAFLLDRGWSQLRQFAGVTGGWAWLLALVPLAFARARAGAAALLVAVVLRLAFHVWSGGPWMGRGRFLAPILPILLVLVSWGIVLVLRRGPRLALGLAVATALVLFPGWREERAVEAGSLAYGAHLRAAHGRLGADVAALTRADAVMAMDDAGLAPLVAGRTNIDLLGLNDRHLGRLPGNYAEKSDPQYVFDRHPDVIVLVARHSPPLEANDLLVPSEVPLFTDPLFAERYRFAREYPFESGYRLLLYVLADSPRVLSGLRAGSPAATPIAR